MYAYWAIRGVLIFALSASAVYANYGERWDFLGEARIDGNQDHGNIFVTRRDGPFHALRLRVNDGEIFFVRIIVHYSDDSTEELAVFDRVLSGSQTPPIDLSSASQPIVNVELRYFKVAWEHQPKVTLFGRR